METAKRVRKTPSLAIDAEIGERAHMLIWGARRTQGDVAAEIGISSGALGLKLKGNRGWAIAELVSLASALNTTVSYLVGESDAPVPGGPAGIRPTAANQRQKD